MFREAPTAYYAAPRSTETGSDDAAPMELRRLVQKVMEGEQVKLVAPEDLAFGKSLSYELPELIKRADMIVADISGPSANTMYEVGMAQALLKPLLVLSRDPSPPADLRSLQIIQYRAGDLEKVGYYLHDWVSEQRRRFEKLRAQ